MGRGAVLKTVGPQGSGGSSPLLSAKLYGGIVYLIAVSWTAISKTANKGI